MSLVGTFHELFHVDLLLHQLLVVLSKGDALTVDLTGVLFILQLLPLLVASLVLEVLYLLGHVLDLGLGH